MSLIINYFGIFSDLPKDLSKVRGVFLTCNGEVIKVDCGRKQIVNTPSEFYFADTESGKVYAVDKGCKTIKRLRLKDTCTESLEEVTCSEKFKFSEDSSEELEFIDKESESCPNQECKDIFKSTTFVNQNRLRLKLLSDRVRIAKCSDFGPESGNTVCGGWLPIDVSALCKGDSRMLIYTFIKNKEIYKVYHTVSRLMA